MKTVNWLSIDIPRCSLSFGNSPCTATGVKCFNTLGTCKDLPNYTADGTRAFFTDSTIDLDAPVGAIYNNAIPIPNIQSVSLTPARLALGEGIGARAVLRVTFADHPTTDLQSYEDPYVHDRDYDPWKRGTFWGKFLARHKFLRGQLVRWAVVDPEQLGFDDFPDDHQIFVIDRIDGPDSGGNVTLTAKDPLTFLDDKRAIAPALSRGTLFSAINDTTTSATLQPSGIGNAEYPASGFVAIGGKEICSFTRSGDVLTLTRGQFNTEAIEHDEDDRVQVCLRYDAEDASDILFDLVTTYGRIDSQYIPLSDWQDQTTTFIARLYSGIIAEPTPVKDLVEEILLQAGITIWWDGRLLRLQVLRDIPSSGFYDDEKFLPGSVSKREQPEKRISQVWVYFGQINPLEALEDAKNYAVCNVTAQGDVANLEKAFDNVPSVRTIFSRWIVRQNRVAANRVNTFLLRRYGIPPRLVTFDLLRNQVDLPPQLAQGVTIETLQNQDATGGAEALTAQVIELRPSADRISVQAEEITFIDIEDPDDPANKIVDVDTNETDYNLRQKFLEILPEAVEGDNIICRVQRGVIIGSSSVNTPAFDVGTGWPAGNYSIKLVIQPGAFVVGRAGQGGGSAFTIESLSNPVATSSQGGVGGLAFRTQKAIEIENLGTIGGGGGGGGGSARGGTYSNINIGLIGITTSAGGGAGAGFFGGSGGSASATSSATPTSGDIARQGRNTQNVTTPGGASTPAIVEAVFRITGSPGFDTTVNVTSIGGGGGLLGQPGNSASTSQTISGLIPITNNTSNSLSTGGPAGTAIDGFSLCTISGSGQILGPTIN